MVELEKEADKVNEDEHIRIHVQAESPEPQHVAPSTSGLWENFDKISSNSTSSTAVLTTGNKHPIENKLLLNISEPLLLRKEDSLLWWKQNSARFPLFEKYPRCYLGICATSASSETVFRFWQYGD